MLTPRRFAIVSVVGFAGLAGCDLPPEKSARPVPAARPAPRPAAARGAEPLEASVLTHSMVGKL
jgi:hypothetical protein